MSPAKVQRARPLRREFFAQDLTPLAVYRRLRERSGESFLLESVTGGDQVSRYSFLGSGPAEIYRLYLDRLEIERRGEVSTVHERPLATLAERLSSIEAEHDDLPFTGGYVGYFGYDLARLRERLPSPPADPFDLPVAQLARFDSMLVYDHARQRLTAVANEIEGQVDRSAAEAELTELTDLLQDARPERMQEVSAIEDGGRTVESDPLVSDARFESAVGRAQEYIRAGDILQVVLARRWRVETDVEPESLYRAVRLINPSPYMVLLESAEMALVGASPEMLVRKQRQRLETRPIAGTRRRGATPDEDRALAQDLLADDKERAEHVMLVDLGRNDLGRVARPASVTVPTFMEVERYSHVMHLVSSVEAESADGLEPLEALLACFPAGTVSGAPKIRAMEIIDELETEARGPYAGAVGYLSYNGDLDTCITIRTLMVQGGSVSVTAGAGIVADSIPAREGEETRNKAAGLLAAVEVARTLEEAK